MIPIRFPHVRIVSYIHNVKIMNCWFHMFVWCKATRLSRGLCWRTMLNRCRNSYTSYSDGNWYAGNKSMSMWVSIHALKEQRKTIFLALLSKVSLMVRTVVLLLCKLQLSIFGRQSSRYSKYEFLKRRVFWTYLWFFSVSEFSRTQWNPKPIESLRLTSKGCILNSPHSSSWIPQFNSTQPFISWQKCLLLW